FNGLHVVATVPGDTLYAFAPDLTVSGPAHVDLSRPEGESAFTLTVDLLDTDIAFSSWLRKRPGTSAAVTLAGITNGPGWRAHTIALAAAGEQIDGEFVDGKAVRFPRVQVALNSLTPLFPAGAALDGTVSGTYD